MASTIKHVKCLTEKEFVEPSLVWILVPQILVFQSWRESKPKSLRMPRVLGPHLLFVPLLEVNQSYDFERPYDLIVGYVILDTVQISNTVQFSFFKDTDCILIFVIGVTNRR